MAKCVTGNVFEQFYTGTGYTQDERNLSRLYLLTSNNRIGSIEEIRLRTVIAVIFTQYRKHIVGKWNITVFVAFTLTNMNTHTTTVNVSNL